MSAGRQDRKSPGTMGRNVSISQGKKWNQGNTAPLRSVFSTCIHLEHEEHIPHVGDKMMAHDTTQSTFSTSADSQVKQKGPEEDPKRASLH